MKYITLIFAMVPFLMAAQTTEELSITLDSLKSEKDLLESEIKPILEQIEKLTSDIKFTEVKIKQLKENDIQANGITVTTSMSAKLYSKPEVSDVITRIDENIDVQAFSKTGFYYKVKYDGVIGYIHEISLNKSKELNELPKEKIVVANQSNVQTTTNIISLQSYGTVHKYPSEESLELKTFSKTDIEIIGYANQMFKVKSTSGQIGYTPYMDIGFDEARSQKKIIDEKILKSEKAKNKRIIIRGAGVSDINSANGVDFSIDWAYVDNTKDIKYIEFTVTPYNNVGDLQKCNISGHSNFTGKVTGPISANEKFDNSTWGTAWYNNTISCIKLNKVEVFYIDGSKYTYVKELPKILESNYQNTCSY